MMPPSLPPDEPGPRRRTAPVQGSGARYEALIEILEEQARSAEEQSHGAPGRDGRAARRVQKVVLAALVLLTAWVWILPPAWLVPPPPERPSVAEEEAALRFGMYLQAQRVRTFQLEHGALPIALEEAGPTIPGISYTIVAPGVYELSGSTDRVSLTYRSDEPLREWVGAGSDVINERRLP